MEPQSTANALRRAILSIVLIGLGTHAAAEQSLVLEVDAGDYDRNQSVAEFQAPGLAKGQYRLQTAGGEQELLQVDSNHWARLMVKQLPKGTKRRYTLESKALPEQNPLVQARLDYKKVAFDLNNQRIFEYQGPPAELPRPDIDPLYTRGGYIHPVISPSGLRVTDDFPVNHVHHHGIWFPWTHTRFQDREPDFWNMGAGKGKVEFVHFGEITSGSVWAELKTSHRFVDMTIDPNIVVLSETWNIRLYDLNAFEIPVSVFDLVSLQTCATAYPLILPQYRYGGLGVRGNGEWNGEDNCFFLTSNGETDRVKAHATRARWCHMGGRINGQWTGLAILCHPDNFRFPQPMRIHPKEPFFCYAPQLAGDMQINPGESYTSRYRFLIMDGKPDGGMIDRAWNDFAHPVKVSVSHLTITR